MASLVAPHHLPKLRPPETLGPNGHCFPKHQSSGYRQKVSGCLSPTEVSELAQAHTQNIVTACGGPPRTDRVPSVASCFPKAMSHQGARPVHPPCRRPLELPSHPPFPARAQPPHPTCDLLNSPRSPDSGCCVGFVGRVSLPLAPPCRGGPAPGETGEVRVLDTGQWTLPGHNKRLLCAWL